MIPELGHFALILALLLSMAQAIFGLGGAARANGAQRLILGGGVLTHCPGLRLRLVEGVQTYSSQTSREGLFVADAELGDDSGLIGAALLA